MQSPTDATIAASATAAPAKTANLDIRLAGSSTESLNQAQQCAPHLLLFACTAGEPAVGSVVRHGLREPPRQVAGAGGGNVQKVVETELGGK